MRPIILASIVALMLLLTPTAFATGDDHKVKGKQASEAAKADRHKDTEDAPAARAEARRGESETANRTAAIDRLLEQVRALRASWKENASAAREACHAAAYDAENGTKETRAKWAHCIRDAYKAWRDANRGEMRELKEEMRQTARDMRDARAAKHDA